MIPSKTHQIKTPCEKFTIFVTEAGEDIIINADKGGSCRAVLFEVIGKLVTALGIKKSEAILRDYRCESNTASRFKGETIPNFSCVDKMMRVLLPKEETKEEKK